MWPSELAIFFGLEDRILLRFSAIVPLPFLLTQETAASRGQRLCPRTHHVLAEAAKSSAARA